VAELLEKQLGIKAETVPGDRGEFTIRVGGKVVAQKGLFLFPSNKKVVEAVRRELNS
jgi:hypothetical protein